MTARGVFPILPTPFSDGGEVDIRSLARLVEFEVDVGAHGLAILGFLGEAHKLANSERAVVIRAAIEAASGEIPVWVGVRSLGAAGAIEQAREAQKLGAEAVFVAPIRIQNDDVIFDFYASVADAIDIPVVVHDYPESFGTTLSTELIARMAVEIGGVQYVKLEDPPVLTKLTELLGLVPDRLGVFGGLGGTFFVEELERGSRGVMTGFAYPEVLTAIYEAFYSGQPDRATRIFDRYVSLIRYEFQPKLGLAIRKYIYFRRGLIASQHIRRPGTNLDPYTEKELENVIHRVGLTLDGDAAVELGES